MINFGGNTNPPEKLKSGLSLIFQSIIKKPSGKVKSGKSMRSSGRSIPPVGNTSPLNIHPGNTRPVDPVETGTSGVSMWYYNMDSIIRIMFVDMEHPSNKFTSCYFTFKVIISSINITICKIISFIEVIFIQRVNVF